MSISGLSRADLFIERAFIGGEWASARQGRTINVDNPASGEVLGTVPDCDELDTRAAIDAAAEAFPAWRNRTAGERAALLERWHGLILENLADLARIMTAEQGKPLAEAEGEIRYAATFVKWFAEEGRRICGHDVRPPEANRRIFVTKEPVGVSAAITPWNFPAAMITRKCAPALAAGCPIVVKPSDLTPYTALALGKLAEEAGFPSGVISIVTGMPQAIGAEITRNPKVRKLSFTGSTRIGALLMRQCSDTIKKLSLELGGNSPLIVFDDADLDLAVASTMASKFRNAGQTCVCANRILVQDGVHDEFAARLGKAVQQLTVGPGDAPGVTTGPLINAAGVEKVRAHLDDALANGASAFATVESSLDPNRFVAPVVLTGANSKMRLASEETFGPVAPLFRFRHEEGALEMANSTPFGLASYFFTEDLHRAFRVAERLEAGIVALNTGGVSMEMAPFGGVKQSGLGREGGREGIEEYLETKAFHVGGLKL
ncbi:MAG: NAD-dependent succinate-semialdehyde dehydrogenase [Sphingomicrobium sp.]